MKGKSYFTKTGFEVKYIGPDLKAGPLPAAFYFILSADDSLFLDVFNQPAQFLVSDKMRVFSVTIPGHGPDLDKEKAIEYWASKVKEGKCPLSHFFDETFIALEELRSYFLDDKIGFCGLSRGSFVALHLASKLKYVKNILAFAPLLKLDHAKEFQDLQSHPLVKNLDTFQLIDQLVHKNIRIYIGNRDVRVGTKHSFDFISQLADCAHEKRIRSSDFELFITSSIGFSGHGTPTEIFQNGCDWLKAKLDDE